MKLLYNDDVLPVGKYQGKTIEEVINIDPMYIKTFNGGYKTRGRRDAGNHYGQYAIADITLENIKPLNHFK